MTAENLAELIQAAKARHGYTYKELSEACGGSPSSARLQQLAAGPPADFPTTTTIRNIARGCQVPEFDVIKAAARSLEFGVEEEVDLVFVPGFGHLPPHIQHTFRLLGQQVGSLPSNNDEGGEHKT
jgi:transcriptional regulator with XRE-family HTH domain